MALKKKKKKRFSTNFRNSMWVLSYTPPLSYSQWSAALSLIRWCDYLLLLHLLLSQHRVVALVFISQTQVADTLPVCAAVHLQQLVVSAADRLPELFGGRHQPVFLEGGGLVVRLDVHLAVGGQTHQAGFHSLVLPPGADVALHVLGLGKALLRRRPGLLESSLLEFLHHVGQHGVSGEHRPRVEVLPTLWADVDPQVVVLVPVVLDAVRAVAVSAWDGHRVPQHVQTDRAVELVLVQNHPGVSHRPQTPRRA